MKPEKFIVTFKTGRHRIVHAFSKSEAIILAQAEEINAGNRYEVLHVQRQEMDYQGNLEWVNV